MTLSDIARVCHEANRALQIALSDPEPSLSWGSAPQWQKDASLAGVEAALSGQTPQELHESWSAHKRADGWRYGPVKDAQRKTHPCLVPYERLPEGEKAKDRVFHAVVAALAPSMV